MLLTYNLSTILQGLPQQIIPSFVPSGRFHSIRFKNRSSVEVKNSHNAASKPLLYEGVDCQVFSVIFRDYSVYRGYNPRRRISLTFHFDSGLLVSYVPSRSKIYVQERGFRARKSGLEGLHSRRRDLRENDSWLNRIFPLLKVPKFSTITKHKQGTDKSLWTAYETSLKQLSNDKQKSFTEGFIRGIDLGKGSGDHGRTKLKYFVDILVPLAVLFVAISILRQNFRAGVEISPEEVTVTFADVKGMESAKKEVREIVDFLRDPSKYEKIGGRLPKGILLIGPPGTGKTLLARAIAGEANVPFFQTSGSEFDEMFVGLGAKRIRDLFEKAKYRAPCIIFIDEIDSVGSSRVTNSFHPYANQTINQLLTEMDGFSPTHGIIVIGATNRVEDLDSALLRPGRFDLRTVIAPPDSLERLDIIRHYLKAVAHDSNMDVGSLAKLTVNFTGADIESMVNGAAIRAAVEGFDKVEMQHLMEAKNRILLGPARAGGRLPDENANRITAYHEAGHALVGLLTEGCTSLHQVTIIQRGPSLGSTYFAPESEEYHKTKTQMLGEIDLAMGGRAAEEIIFGPENITSGASSDFSFATKLATQMVKKFGMSEKVGVQDFTERDAKQRKFGFTENISEKLQETIDQEIDRILKESYSRATSLLLKYKKEHKLIADALLEFETLTGEEIKELVEEGRISKRNWL